MRVDIDVLIEKVYVSPTAPKWFYELTKAILQRYGYDKEVIHSELNQDPMYYQVSTPKAGALSKSKCYI